MHGVMETVCGNADYSSPPIADPEGVTRDAFRRNPG
jgi:hypothetical protein